MAIPFTIQEEANLLPLKNAKNSGDNIYADCPFCGSRGAMHISLSRNVWNCMSCQMKGANNSGGGRTELYGKFFNITNGQAYRDICDQLGLQNNPKKEEQNEELGINEREKRTPRELDYVYRAFLSLLTLSEVHENNLKNRGLNDEAIKRHFYKTIPITNHTEIVRTLLSYNMNLEGIPGFYVDDDGEWQINLSSKQSGIFCPIVDREGYIVGIQKRLDRPFYDKKYIWFSSSGKKLGSSPGSPVHFVGNPLADTVFLTEGSLKANVAHELSKELFDEPISFFAVAGVTQYKAIRQALWDIRTFQNKEITVYDAFDMDKFKNPNVYRAMSKIFDIAQETGIRMVPYRWNTIEAYGDFTPNVPYQILIEDKEYAFYSYVDTNGKTCFSNEFFANNGSPLVIPEPIIDSEHPHKDIQCKLINTETGAYIEFSMYVDKEYSQYNGYTFLNRKGIDDYFLSLVKERHQRMYSNVQQ